MEVRVKLSLRRACLSHDMCEHLAMYVRCHDGGYGISGQAGPAWSTCLCPRQCPGPGWALSYLCENLQFSSLLEHSYSRGPLKLVMCDTYARVTTILLGNTYTADTTTCADVLRHACTQDELTAVHELCCCLCTHLPASRMNLCS